jgi:hypothetical protein
LSAALLDSWFGQSDGSYGHMMAKNLDDSVWSEISRRIRGLLIDTTVEWTSSVLVIQGSKNR